mgnify:CR=1 FL=1
MLITANTATMIVIFLRVFLIQNSQNRDAAAMLAKLDELILSEVQCLSRGSEPGRSRWHFFVADEFPAGR